MAHDKGKSVLEENSLWGGCHAFFVLASILYALTAVPLFYRYGTAALCMALAVEAYNAMHSSKQPMIDALAGNQVIPMLFLAFYLFLVSATPIGVLLFPLALSSLVKATQAARQHPRFTSYAAWKSHLQPVAERILASSSTILHQSLHLQLALVPWLLFSVFSHGVLPVLVYVGVLRWQYLVDEQMRVVMRTWDAWITTVVEHPTCPKMARRWIGKAQAMVKSWGKSHQPLRTPTARPVSR